MKIGNGEFLHGDCLDLMAGLPDASVDMILCDLPYGTTACAWDTIIPFEPLWSQYWRVAKPNAAIVLTASQPFTTALISSALPNFKYCWVWEKSRPTGHVHAKNKPMKKHEDVLVFSKGTTVHVSQSVNRMVYNPQGLSKLQTPAKRKPRHSDAVMARRPSHRETISEITGFPNSILSIPSETGFHPTQKPVALFEYLIRTYTNHGALVLDNCAGSGTTAIAAEQSGRRWVCMEKDPEYWAKAVARVAQHVALT